MMKGKLKLIVPTVLLILLITIVGIAYAFFEYYRVGNNHQLIVGNIYLNLDDGTDTLSVINVFPEPVSEARARTDNLLTFTISGVNTTTDNDVWYEIRLNEGDGVEGRTRANVEHLVFDLIEINENNEEVLLLDAVTYDVLNDTKIWVDSVERNTTTELKRTYKLRMWLSEDVFISDTNPNADYTTGAFRTSFASVKVSVYGDFVEKRIEYSKNYMARLGSTSETFWPDNIEAEKANISEVHFISLNRFQTNDRYNSSTIKADVTDTSLGGSVSAWLEPNPNDTSKYIMYVASDGETYFPSDCGYMFNGYGISSITFDNINSSRVTNMMYLFSGCSNLLMADMSMMNMINVKSVLSMFRDCSSLKDVNLNNWDLRSLENYYSANAMFHGCIKLTGLEVSGWKLYLPICVASLIGNSSGSPSGIISLKFDDLDVSGCNSFDTMFASCSQLESIKIKFIGCDSITNMNTMFAGCSKLTNLELENFDTSNVTNMMTMFTSCSSLEYLDLSAWDTSKVTDMSTMFAGCTNLTTIYANSDWNTGVVTNSSNMFGGCTSLIGAVSFDSNKTDITMANPDTGYFTRKEA